MLKTFRNSRNETASTDGARWWSGNDTDEATIVLHELQPISALLPESPEPTAVTAELVAKARKVFISALRQSAPSVSPADDAERAIFRKAWDDATAFASAHDIIATGQPVFDCGLMVVGTADAIVRATDGTAYSYCYSPECYEWAGETNALVNILHGGYPIPCADDSHGRYSLREFSHAIMALLIRDRTPWYAKHMSELPF